MIDSVRPSEIEIGGVEEYDDSEALLNTMSEVKKIETSDSFQQQFVDLGGEGDPMIQFSSEIEDTGGKELVNMRGQNDDDEEGNPTLQIFLDFPYESITTFNATLNDILDIIGGLTVEYLQITYKMDIEFMDIEVMTHVDNSLDYELQGIRVGGEDFTYTFQTADEGLAVVATLQDETNISPDSNEDFIKAEVDTANRFVEEICNG
ncbi:hypothetical protein [Haloarcula marina]|uniref:hypothetical protein n=1 Tax=Haloarcula marina TaxID=2961574 RepID=UPI0020B88A88|nr:hypothetical protein [Halomicroarcula marina]